MEHKMAAPAKGHQKSRKPEKGIRKKNTWAKFNFEKKKNHLGTAHGMKKEQNNRQTTMWWEKAMESQPTYTIGVEERKRERKTM